MDRIELTLEEGVDLFESLVRLAVETGKRGHHLRLIGGAAMLLWGRSMNREMDMTRDLDCAILGDDVPDEQAAGRFCSMLDAAAKALGRRRPSGWKQSRVARFKYLHPEEGHAEIEFLCGDLAVGRPSRRPPAWRIARVDPAQRGDAEPPDFYASHVPWLSKVQAWVQARMTCGSACGEVLVPDLAGLAALKLKAVADKLDRLDSATSAEDRDYEQVRLERHARHLAQAVGMMESAGTLDRLPRLIRSYPEVRLTARDVEGRIQRGLFLVGAARSGVLRALARF